MHTFSFHDLFSMVHTLFPLYSFSIFQKSSMVHAHCSALVYELKEFFVLSLLKWHKFRFLKVNVMHEDLFLQFFLIFLVLV